MRNASASSQLSNLPSPSSTSPPGSQSSSSRVPLSLRPPLRSSHQSPSPPSVTSPSAALHGQSLLPPHASQTCCPPSLTSSAFSPATTSPYGPRHTHSRAPSTSLSHYGPTTGCPRMSISSSSVSSARLPRLRSSDPSLLSLSASSQSTPALILVQRRLLVRLRFQLEGVNCLSTSSSSASPRLASFGRLITTPSVASRLWLPLSCFRLHHRPPSRTLRLSPTLACHPPLLSMLLPLSLFHLPSVSSRPIPYWRCVLSIRFRHSPSAARWLSFPLLSQLPARIPLLSSRSPFGTL